AELDRIALTKPVRFEAVATGRDDVALLGFTSGTTGVPKATMHFHRDLLIIADGYAKDVLGVTPDAVFVGSPPLPFTFGRAGATEMLHIFISNRLDDLAPGSTGKPVRGYEARVVDDDMKELPRGTVGRLAVRGPTGCRYLADERQRNYVRDGWNLTGDSFVQD